MKSKINVKIDGSQKDITSTYTTKMLRGGNFAAQVKDVNTKYIIKWDFDLKGQTITMPTNTLLEFDGGSISNGTLVGNQTVLIYFQDKEDILKDVILEGTWKNIAPYQVQELLEQIDEHSSKIETLQDETVQIDGIKEDIREHSVEFDYINDKIDTLIERSGGGGSDVSLSRRAPDYSEFRGMKKIILYPSETSDNANQEVTEETTEVTYQAMLTQENFTEPNTIYVIQYDFTLGGDINIPANCVLEFDGGSLSNGTVTGNNTSINAGLVKIFDTNVALGGTWNVSYAYPEWFGAKGDGETDDYAAIQKTVDSFKKILFSEKVYCINDTITLSHAVIFKGFNSKLKNIKATSVAMLSVINIDYITVDGIEFDNNAILETGYHETLCFRNGVIDFKNCNHTIICNCKVYNVRNQQSNIICQGDYNEIHHCEVYTGSGNRMTSGIVCGWFNMADSTQESGAGCKYCSVHDCYVHDISIATADNNVASESGYGIYLLGSSYCSVYNNVVENINWAGINSQSEGRVPGGRDNKIYNNTVILNSELVHPRHDYFGPFLIYTERTASCEVFDNILNIGVCNSGNGRYVPLQISDGGANSIVRNNKILKYGNNTPDIWAVMGIDDICVLEDNFCDIEGKSAIFCYNSENFDLTIRNQHIKSTTKQAVNLYADNHHYEGKLTIEDCIIDANTLLEFTSSDIVNLTLRKCIINTQESNTGDGLIVYRNRGTCLIENCVFNDIAKPVIYIRYGEGSITLRNNTFNTVSNYTGTVIRGISSTNTYNNITIENNIFNCGVESRVILYPEAHITKLILRNNIIRFAAVADALQNDVAYVSGNSTHIVQHCLISNNNVVVSNVDTFIRFNSTTAIAKIVQKDNVLLGFASRTLLGNNTAGSIISDDNIGDVNSYSRLGTTLPVIKTNAEIGFHFIKTDFGYRVGFWDGTKFRDADGFPYHKNRGAWSEIPSNPGDDAIGKMWFLTDTTMPIFWTATGWKNIFGLGGSADRTINYADLPVNGVLAGASIFVSDLRVPAFFTGAYWVDSEGFTLAPHKGTTADRPKNSNAGGVLKNTSDNGFPYFDTDLGKPIWAKSVHDVTVDWVDATGTPV